MQTTFHTFISALRHRRAMLFSSHDDCYAQVVAGIVGFDFAMQGDALIGFREWLVMRVGGMSNLAWEVIVDEIAAAKGICAPAEKVECLIDLIEEYLAERSRGVDRLLRLYGQWEQQSWGKRNTNPENQDPQDPASE